MEKILYNKLVRDKIPDIIKVDGKKAEYRILSDDEYLIELNRKLVEEVNEYMESGSLSEIADISEVLDAILSVRGYKKDDFLQVKSDKKENRGGFEKKIFLMSVSR